MVRFLVLFLAGGLLSFPGTAEPAPHPADSTTAYQFDNAKSSMTVYGTSNVRDWTMDVIQITGSVRVGAVNKRLPSIQKVRTEIPVRKLVSDKDRLQRHAHDALKKKKHPTISFTSSNIQVANAEADSFSVVADGDLTIAGETRSIELTATGTQQQDGTLVISGDHRLKLTTYDVERPSLLFGAIKVSDPVRIGFRVVLAPSSQESATE
ncbi:MAG: YceI family protein [Salinibacter sp.]|uniref:YceI family protein n=1 Tax=Salinibacter sp. TaxID=2065818 RepID=UPI0035D45142